MRKQIWIPCIVVLAVCLLLLFETTQHQKIVLPKPSETITNQSSQVGQPKVVVHHQVTNFSQLMSAIAPSKCGNQ
jgi:hypothetical protein